MLALLLLLAQDLDESGLRPDEVLVIANKDSKESLEVAAHYRKQRKIPAENGVELSFPGYRHPAGISFEDFEAKAVVPIKKHLEERGLKDKILCLVTTYDVPYVVNGPALSKEELAELTLKLPEGNRGSAGMILTTRASFDSELAWLYREDAYGLPPGDLKRRQLYCYQTQNPFLAKSRKFRQFRKEHVKGGTIYLTARLDAPTPELAKGLVDLALQAELEGPSGTGYFDSKGKTFGKRKLGYSSGEFWARRAWIDTHNAGFKTVREETGALFAENACPDALIYWGWYALTNYQNSFTPKFRPGAIAVHTASGEAVDLRRVPEKGGPWCTGFLAHGVTACTGPVGEPFLQAFPNAEIFFPRLYQGWTLAEAYGNATQAVSWMMVLIGDPLYTPFGGKHRRPQYTQARIEFLNPGATASSLQPVSRQSVGLILQMQANAAVFKTPAAYKLVDPGTNTPRLKLKNLDQAAFEIRDGGRLLRITGASVETGDLAAHGPRVEDIDELEVHVDLGAEGGLKILSQLLIGLPPAGK